MDEVPVKRKGGRPRGSKTLVGNRKPPSNGWLRDLFACCFSREDYIKKFKSLTTKEQFDLMQRVEPKSVDMGGTGATISLIINSARQGEAQRIDRPGEIVQLPESDPTALVLPKNTQSAYKPMPGGAAAVSESLRGIGKYPAPVEDDPPVQRGAVFKVPVYEDEEGPPEWRGSLFPEDTPNDAPDFLDVLNPPRRR